MAGDEPLWLRRHHMLPQQGEVRHRPMPAQ